jgi:hypothetical protein
MCQQQFSRALDVLGALFRGLAFLFFTSSAIIVKNYLLSLFMQKRTLLNGIEHCIILKGYQFLFLVNLETNFLYNIKIS